jgi:hypothetical protein
MDNERRADLGEMAIMVAASQTSVAAVETAETAVVDVLAYVAHFCNRLRLEPDVMFQRGLNSYDGDSEDGPPAAPKMDPEQSLLAQTMGRIG